jgi:glycerol uptake facilitator-like aquaporin
MSNCTIDHFLLISLGSIAQNEQDMAPVEEEKYGLTSQMIAEIVGTATSVQGNQLCVLQDLTSHNSSLTDRHFTETVGTAANCIALFLDSTDGKWHLEMNWILAATQRMYAAYRISGGHLNPAVTFSVALVRPESFHYMKVLPYWLSQIVGGFLGTICNLAIFWSSLNMRTS